MNARPREPFDAEEADVARVYRGLPGGEPSAELDARILAQARAAIAPPRRRHARPWFLGAGFGTAAAAVMAAGIAWQLGWLGSVPGTATAPATPTGQSASAVRQQKPMRVEEIERVDIEYVKQEPKALDDAPAPPAAPPAPAPPPPPPELRRRDNAPPPATADLREQAPAAMSIPAPQAFPAEVAEVDAALDATASSERAATVATPAQTAPDSTGGLGLGKRMAALPPWTQDAELQPDAWLERIRERVRQGDRQGAEFSLQRFVLMHPRRNVPRELQRLLVE